jgi:hypothetical protein
MKADDRHKQLDSMLKPCPCCKNPTPTLIDLTIVGGVIDESEPAEVECGCGIYAWGSTVKEAVLRWNTRRRRYLGD